MPTSKALNEATCEKLVLNPRLPSGECSARNVSAPADSPPTEKPCSMRKKISRIGAATPIAAYPGRRPTPVVAAEMSRMTATSIRCLPSRSPRTPNTIDPSGRTKNEIA